MKNTLNLAVATQNRVPEMRLNLQKIPVPDKIHLHKKIGEVIYTDLMKATLKVSKLQSTVSRLENQLKQERVENKTYQQQIKKLQGDILAMDSKEDKGKTTKKILSEKEITIQLLKKKLKILATQQIQASKLTFLEKEKESLSQELNDTKSKLLKFS